MPDLTLHRALISVYDKTGVADFARTLVDEFGTEIISTGGTAALLREADIHVTLVEDLTGFGAMLDGRVKTLHPAVHAALLADRDNPDHRAQLRAANLEPIDLVVVNLYPFEETIAEPDCSLAQAIEMIDVGGPTMLRAAAKNHRYVAVLSSPDQYEECLDWIRTGTLDEHRAALAAAVFERLAEYNDGIAAYLMTADDPAEPNDEETLRYGENPHQTAEFHGDADFTRRSGDNLSYNNLVDADAADQLCTEITAAQHGRQELNAAVLGQCACVFIKHTNACGVGLSDDPVEAYRRAYLGDPNAAMGGILAINFPVDSAFAETVMTSLERYGKAAGAGAFFVEVWLAPKFDDDALTVIHERKTWGQRVRLLETHQSDCRTTNRAPRVRTVGTGILTQSPDVFGLNEAQWEVVSDRLPTIQEMNDLRLAWLICKHTKSNAITIGKNGQLIGNGAGQMSRVMSCRLATWIAAENGHESELTGAAAASDAFFPFRDGPDLLLDAGITALIQPGGSKRDADTITACNERHAACIFTHTRHFRH